MSLSDFLTDTKTIKVPYPGLPGFIVEVRYVSKEELKKIGEKAKTIDFDPKTRQPVESIDDELFTKLYVRKSVVGWSGLKFEYLKELVLVDEEALPEEGELPFSEEDAFMLVTNSKSFDAWLTSVISDISLFNKGS